MIVIPHKKLTTWEAACIITGYGIGTGVLSMPWLAARCGVLVSGIVLILAFTASYILHLMIAELSLREGKGAQLLPCLKRYLFRGPLAQLLTTVFFVLMFLILCTNLAAYIAASEEVIVGLIPIPRIAARLLFYAAAAVVVLFGLKVVGISEKVAVGLIFALIGVLAAASLMNLRNPLTLAGGSVDEVLAYYGLAMFAMSAFFSVPQAVEGLDGDIPSIRKAIFLGLGNNFLLIVVISLCSLASSSEITPVAMVGWSAGLGLWAQVLGSIFTILAMLTTYWSLSLALGDMAAGMFRLGRRRAWLIATVPSLLLVLLNVAGFMELMRLAGGLIAIIIAVMIVPAFHNARQEASGTLLNGSSSLDVFIIFAYVLMAVGSLITI